ncbi:MAG TPA: TetR/AcrR family transcriptional regulator [Terracidiphilus sp.]|nr:TetR/AcrR family transcriptional regulator [Terracidiphilus sp.]
MPETALPTRDRILNSARHLFWEKGFAGTSMADLLANADVNSGSFYHFFDSKEALLREVLDGYRGLLRPMVIDPAFSSVEEPLGRIFAVLEGYRRGIVATDCRYGCPIGRLALEIDPENAPAHALMAQNFQAWVGCIRECLDTMAAALPPDTDLDALATFVLVVMEGGVMLSRSYKSVEPFDRAVDQLRQHFRLLLAGREPDMRRKAAQE